MKEILAEIARWQAEGDTAVALATVVETWGSSPRRTGSKMAITAAGHISGSVSGGCVEGSVIEAGINTIESGIPQLLHYGVADETAWQVGLACGGSIDVFVEALDPSWQRLYREIIAADRSAAIATIIQASTELLGQKVAFIKEGERHGFLNGVNNDELQARVSSIHKPQRLTLQSGVEVFVDVIKPKPVLVMVGGVHIAIALTREAKSVGYQTVVIDPRRAFGSEYRFPEVDRLIQQWPKQAFQEVSPSPEMAVALLTHDPKIDDQALEVLLNSDVFYIGALGSQKTHAKRQERLRKMGFADNQIARIFAPIGLDIGAENPEEIALSIMAEITGVRRGKIVAP